MKQLKNEFWKLKTRTQTTIETTFQKLEICKNFSDVSDLKIQLEMLQAVLPPHRLFAFWSHSVYYLLYKITVTIAPFTQFLLSQCRPGCDTSYPKLQI